MKTDSYDAVATALAQRLQLPDPSFVQFTQQSSFTKAAKVRGDGMGMAYGATFGKGFGLHQRCSSCESGA